MTYYMYMCIICSYVSLFVSDIISPNECPVINVYVIFGIFAKNVIEILEPSFSGNGNLKII